MVKDPVPIRIRSYVRKLVRISPEIENLRQSQFGKRLCPDLHGSVAALLHENHFPVIVTDSDQITVVAKVEVEITGALIHLAGDVIEQIETIDMVLESLAVRLVTTLL